MSKKKSIPEGLGEHKELFEHIVRELNACLEIPSRTFMEKKLAQHVTSIFEDLGWNCYETTGLRGVKAYGCFGNPNKDLIYVAHLDRVNAGKTSASFRDNNIICQLDDSVGLAMLIVAAKLGYKFNVILSTEEEYVQSSPGVIAALDGALYKDLVSPDVTIINVDIYPAIKENVARGVVEIKTEGASLYDRELVESIWSLATDNDISFYSPFRHGLPIDVDFLSEEYSVASIALPILNYHSGIEEANVDAVLNMFFLLVALQDQDRWNRDKKRGVA